VRGDRETWYAFSNSGSARSSFFCARSSTPWRISASASAESPASAGRAGNPIPMVSSAAAPNEKTKP
jgi:hypothetical protein